MYKRVRNRVIAYPKFVRIGIGVLLIIGGFLGFLPVLGFWMLPLGIGILAYDVPAIHKRWRRWAARLRLWRMRRRRPRR